MLAPLASASVCEALVNRGASKRAPPTLRMGSSCLAMALRPSASCLIFWGLSFSRCISWSLILPWEACSRRTAGQSRRTQRRTQGGEAVQRQMNTMTEGAMPA